MRVGVKKLHPNAVIPKYAKPGDAGLDLTAVEIINDEGFQVTYKTGLAFEIPLGYVGLIFPRSSVRNYQLSLSNCVGVIDSGYRGEVQFTFNKLAGIPSKKYEVGDRIGQMIIMPHPEVLLVEMENLSTTERGDGGFGSSGN
ncbi:dUTP diphosphatase [bacterium]|jgi:dUTP pyrophosphatase|nr:dUTP diphosphatase [bacterium]